VRTMVLWLAAIAGCAGLLSPSAPPAEVSCPTGAQVRDPETVAPWRVLPDTEVSVCLGTDGQPDGPHVETWPDAVASPGLAAEGLWMAGRRHGPWTTWWPDGAFRSQVTWERGVEQGLRLELSEDGRLIEIEMEAGQAISLRTRPRGSPMPEWDGSERTEGTRHEGHGASP
jgi:hypothetical protein